jgi:hypothetical protein
MAMGPLSVSVVNDGCCSLCLFLFLFNDKIVVLERISLCGLYLLAWVFFLPFFNSIPPSTPLSRFLCPFSLSAFVGMDPFPPLLLSFIFPFLCLFLSFFFSTPVCVLHFFSVLPPSRSITMNMIDGFELLSLDDGSRGRGRAIVTTFCYYHTIQDCI